MMSEEEIRKELAMGNIVCPECSDSLMNFEYDENDKYLSSLWLSIECRSQKEKEKFAKTYETSKRFRFHN